MSQRPGLLLFLLVGALAGSAAASPTKDVRRAGDSWARALSSNKPKSVVDHYDRGAVLLGTFSPTARTTKADKTAYFRGLMEKPGLKVEFAPGDKVQLLGDSHALRTGNYTFSFDGKDGTVKIPARYSYTYARDARGEWKIKEHHSSVIPDGH